MKFKGFFLIALIFLSINTTLANENKFKVIKVIDGDTFYVDFNNNAIAEKDEKVRVNGVDTFEVKPTEFLEYQVKNYGLTQDEALGLGYLGKEFAKKQLLNKYVVVKYTGETERCDMGRHLVSIYYDGKNYGETSERNKNAIFNFRASKPKDRRSYEQEVLKTGLAVVYQKSNLAPQLQRFENLDKIKAHAKSTHRLHLVLLNKKNGKYHKPTCEYGLMASDVELINKNWHSHKYKPSGCCYVVKKKKTKPLKDIEKPTPDVHTQFVDIYYQDPIKYNRPANYARTSAAQRLLDDLKKAQESVEFAIYGIGGQPEIFNAIVDAKAKGLQVRGVTDMDRNHKNEYSDTQSLINKLGEETLKTDFYFTKVAEAQRDKYIREHWDVIKINEYKGFTEKAKYFIDSKKVDLSITSKDILLVQKGIMHNKFFVIDKKIVWTGSTNISSSGIGGYNCNVMTRIENPQIAQLYLKEIDQMHTQEKFHQSKSAIPNNEKIKLDENTTISVYFLPKHKPVENTIRPLLQKAETRIYVPMFYLTHNDLVQDLIDAKQKRNLDVVVILDASGAQNLYAKHKLMRQAGIPVYVENWGGKMHMKSAIIDDVFVLGSMNWTKSGTTNNDENVMVIYNKAIADKSAEYFHHLIKSIPEKWLYSDPKPESPDSINSCCDGLDNDHDGLTDKDSPYCKDVKSCKNRRCR